MSKLNIFALEIICKVNKNKKKKIFLLKILFHRYRYLTLIFDFSGRKYIGQTTSHQCYIFCINKCKIAVSKHKKQKQKMKKKNMVFSVAASVSDALLGRNVEFEFAGQILFLFLLCWYCIMFMFLFIVTSSA